MSKYSVAALAMNGESLGIEFHFLSDLETQIIDLCDTEDYSTYNYGLLGVHPCVYDTEQSKIKAVNDATFQVCFLNDDDQ